MRTAPSKQAVLAVLVGCLALAGANSQSGQAAPNASCPDYLIIDSRGSGAPAGTTSPPGAAFFSEFRKLRPGATVEVANNAYPAVGGLLEMLKAKARAKVKFIPPTKYNRSVSRGEKWLTNEIVSWQKSCARTKLYLVGLSQGAQVAGNVYQSGEFENVNGVLLFGDTLFNPNDSSAHNYGFTVLGGSLGRRKAFDNPKVQSYCHVGDPVCFWSVGNLWTNFFRMHKNYGGLGEPRLAAKYFTKLEGSSGSSPPPSGPTDKWPTKKNDVSIGVSMYLGTEFQSSDWMSCSPRRYCIAGVGDTVWVFSLVYGVERMDVIPSNVASPWAELAKLGIPEPDIQKLLAP